MQITVEDFKTQFPRFSPQFLPVYEEGKTYFEGDIVYYNELFYICKVKHTGNNPTVLEDWEITKQDVLNYTQDSDIENAIKEALVNFNEALFSDEETRKLVFLYLVAFYITLDFDIALGNASAGVVTSKSVGSVSESYGIPQWMLNDSMLGIYAKNGYGLKYLSLIKPYLIGNIVFLQGATTID